MILLLLHSENFILKYLRNSFPISSLSTELLPSVQLKVTTYFSKEMDKTGQKLIKIFGEKKINFLPNIQTQHTMTKNVNK